MTDKRFDARPKGKHKVRSHIRKTPTGYYTRIADYMRMNPGGWSTQDFTVHSNQVGDNDQLIPITFGDRMFLTRDILKDSLILTDVDVEDLGNVHPRPDQFGMGMQHTRGLKVTYHLEKNVTPEYFNTSHFGHEMESVFGVGNVDSVDIDSPSPDKVVITYWIYNEGEF